MTYYSVLSVTRTTDGWIPDYLGPANELVAKHGGTYVARTACHEQREGAAASAGLRIVIEWPSAAAAKAFMADPGYVPHLAARTAGSVSTYFVIEGSHDMA